MSSPWNRLLSLVSISVICVPMVITGFRYVAGSWKTIAISASLASLISSFVSRRRSLPSSKISPLTTSAF